MLFHMDDSKHTKGVVSLILLTFGFAVIAITARYLSYHFTLFQQLYLSLAVAFIFSLFLFKTNFSFSKIKKIPKKDWVITLVRVVIGYLIGAPLYREAIVITKISNVTFIQSLPFAAIFGWILFKEKFTFLKFFLVLLAYFGVILIAIKDYGSTLSFGRGEIFSLVATALFALSFLMRKWMSDTLNDKEITQILLLLGTVSLFIISISLGEKLPVINWSLLLFVSIFFTGLFNAVNMFFINYGFKNVKAVLAGNILTLEAIFALILAFIFYKELPTLKELIGGFLIIGSVIQMNRIK